MNFELSDQQELFIKGVSDFARGEVAPRSKAMDRDGAIPDDLMGAMKDHGFFALTIPEAYGGLGLDTLTYGLVVAELARVDAGVAITVGVHNSVGTYPLLGFASEDLRRRTLPEMVKGNLACFCLTEPGAGSDASNLTTRAERVEGGYRLSGEKIWVTNGAYARFFVVMARLAEAPAGGHESITAFLLRQGTEGLTIGAKEEKMGLRCSNAVSLVLDDVYVDEADRIGEEGEGFKVAMNALDGGRIGVAFQSIGLARACLESATRYAQQREAFGHPIARHQAIQWMLAETTTELEAATLLAQKAAMTRDAGRPVSKLAAMAKYFASEMVGRAADRAVQIHGGFGYSKEYAVERYYRDARVLRIYEGTTEIQKLVIARRHLAGDS